MSLRKSTNNRLINAKYITTDIRKCTEWQKVRRNCALLDESAFDGKFSTYTQQAIIYTSVLGQISEGSIRYAKYGIPNRVKTFNY